MTRKQAMRHLINSGAQLDFRMTRHRFINNKMSLKRMMIVLKDNGYELEEKERWKAPKTKDN